ncbi:MAG TPA: hypothetical protein PKH24_15250 [Sedimentisphaerales bacterium]|jgi:hypothetical protein|nr:hypothetical protein [Sedimentisphaerales bacterium]HNU29216.1 hypothetical protein [Sedimentisphaerales bacterium]
MARQYSPRTFLRKTPNTLLKQYFASQGILGDVDFNKLGETEVQPIMAAMEALPMRQGMLIEEEFRQVHEMSCESGTRVLLEEAEFHGLGLADALGAMASHYERALWVFLNHRSVFDVAGDLAEMDGVGSWRRREVNKGLSPAVDKEDLDNLASGLIEFYKTQGRGYHCRIDNYLRRNPERHCYFAYPEDYATNDMELNENAEFVRRPRKPAFEVIFVYRAESGMLETNARGNKREVDKLLGIFCRTILGLEGLPDKVGARYELSPLANKNIDLRTDPQDGIERVFIKMLRLDVPGTGNRRITFEASNPNDGKAVYKLIDSALAKQNLSPDDGIIAKARFQLKFAGRDGKKGKSLTFEISVPDRCTLKDDPLDQIAREYIEKWGFVVG